MFRPDVQQVESRHSIRRHCTCARSPQRVYFQNVVCAQQPNITFEQSLSNHDSHTSRNEHKKLHANFLETLTAIFSNYKATHSLKCAYIFGCLRFVCFKLSRLLLISCVSLSLCFLNLKKIH
jgi:hypothetical protein